MKFPSLYINAYDCITPAGFGVGPLLDSLYSGHTHLSACGSHYQGILSPESSTPIDRIGMEKAYRDHDRATLMALHTGRAIATRDALNRQSAVVLGSSRGPTRTLESAWSAFSLGNRLHPSTSPASTASGLSAALARSLELEGPSLYVSAACSTGLHAVIQGVAGIIAGLSPACLVGGVEASNTRFTIAMMQAAKVLNKTRDQAFPCRPGASDRSGMVLSEGCALLSIDTVRGRGAVAEIIGWGASTEGGTLTGVSANGMALTRSIRNAFHTAALSEDAIDLIVGHGAGTVKGDAAEMQSYADCFNVVPPIAWHKWCGGHMLGASAALSVILACEHLREGRIPPHPYFPADHPMASPRKLLRPLTALITSMGFGGSACALIVKNLL